MFAKCFIILAIVSATIDAAEYRRTGSDGRQYYINSDQKYNWYQALHKCEQQNQQLVEIHSSQKIDVLYPILRSLFKASLPNLWLGANDEYNEVRDYNRPFYWSTSGKHMTFSNWSVNNPNNFENREHCARIWEQDSTYSWNDLDCTSKLGYICEFNHLSIEKCQDLEAKRKEVSDISTNISVKNQKREEQQTENLENAFKSLEQIDVKLGDVLLQVQTKLAADINQLLIQSVNATMAAVDQRIKSIQKLGVEIKTSAHKSNKEFADILQSSQKRIDDILSC